MTGDTKSKVTVNNPTATALTAAQGKVTMDAVTGSDIDVNVGAVGKKSYVVSNVGLANYDTSADVSINRSITAGAVEVKAENNITGLKITVNNAVKDEESKGKDTAQASDGEKEEDNNAAAAEESKPDSEKSEDEKRASRSPRILPRW